MEEQKDLILAIPDLVERTKIEEVLKETGWEILIAEDAAELIQLAETRRPMAIILADEFGGGDGGLALCKLLKKGSAARATAVVLLCGRAAEIEPSSGTDGRPDEVLIRPVHEAEVVVRLAAMQRLIRYASEVVESSRMDQLTGLFNSTYLLDRLRHEVVRAEQYGRSLAIFLVDLDGFAEINEREGNMCGDLVLREVARALTTRLRGVDLVARTGPDEFTILLPEVSLLVARSISERLRKTVEDIRVNVPREKGRQVKFTVSVGIAGMPYPDISDAPDILRCARAALAKAREEEDGNCSILY